MGDGPFLSQLNHTEKRLSSESSRGCPKPGQCEQGPNVLTNFDGYDLIEMNPLNETYSTKERGNMSARRDMPHLYEAIRKSEGTLNEEEYRVKDGDEELGSVSASSAKEAAKKAKAKWSNAKTVAIMVGDKGGSMRPMDIGEALNESTGGSWDAPVSMKDLEKAVKKSGLQVIKKSAKGMEVKGKDGSTVHFSTGDGSDTSFEIYAGNKGAPEMIDDIAFNASVEPVFDK